jgi:hypothetical protein
MDPAPLGIVATVFAPTLDTEESNHVSCSWHAVSSLHQQWLPQEAGKGLWSGPVYMIDGRGTPWLLPAGDIVPELRLERFMHVRPIAHLARHPVRVHHRSSSIVAQGDECFGEQMHSVTIQAASDHIQTTEGERFDQHADSVLVCFLPERLFSGL